MGVIYELQRHHSSHGDNCTAAKKTHVKKMVNGFFSNGEEEGETLQRSSFHC